MKKIFYILLCFTFFVSNSIAKELKVIVSNPPGSTSDILLRAIGESFKEISGINFVPEYHPGASGAVAAVKFQSSDKETVLLGITSLHIYGPVIEKSLPYKDSDFMPVAIIGLQPGIYISGAGSGIKSIEDMITHLPNSDKPFIGGYASTFNLSVDILKEKGKLQKNVEIVGFKGATDIVLNVLNGTIPVGVVATTSNLYQLAKEGKINIIGSTADNDFEYEGINVFSVSKTLGVPQTTGGILMSLKPNADNRFVEEFVATLEQALNTDKVREAMQKTNITTSKIIGIKATATKITQMRKDVSDIIEK